MNRHHKGFPVGPDGANLPIVTLDRYPCSLWSLLLFGCELLRQAIVRVGFFLATEGVERDCEVGVDARCAPSELESFLVGFDRLLILTVAVERRPQRCERDTVVRTELDRFS